jgi:hypothetical protein
MHALSDSLTDLYRRTVAEIQRKVTKQGKRNVAFRFSHAKVNKDKIAAWKQDLVRALHVFGVRSIGSVRHLWLSGLLPD